MKTIALTVKIFTFNSILILGLLSCKSTVNSVDSNSQSAEHQLAQQGVDATLWFSTSAEMHYAAIQAYDYATLKVKSMVGSKADRTRQLAVILDLDETVLDNSPYMLREIHKGKVYNKNSWKEWTDEASAAAIPGSLEFIRICREMGVEVFFISNRSVKALSSTHRNLIKLGIETEPDRILLRENTSNKDARRDMVFANYEVLLLVGDNLRDFSEVFANRSGIYGKDAVNSEIESLRDKFIIIPNPMYGEWESAIYKYTRDLTNEEKLKLKSEVLHKSTQDEVSSPNSDQR